MIWKPHIPLLQNGRAWLDNQLNKVEEYYETVKGLLETAVEAAAPFLEMLNQWFQDILKWLPFGIGNQAAQVMQSLTDLLAETPHTLSGLDTNIAQPLDVWLVGEGEKTPLQHGVIEPLRTNVMQKANEVIAQAQQVQTTYQARLAEPGQTAVDNQRVVRDLIVQYRQQNQI